MTKSKKAALQRITELQGQVRKNDAEIKAIIKLGDTREDPLPTEDEHTKMKSLSDKNQEFLTEIQDLKSVVDIEDGVTTRDTTVPSNPAGHNEGGSPDRGNIFKSIGDMFAGSDKIKAWVEELGPSGGTGGQRVASPRVDVKSFMKSLITGASGTNVAGLSTSGGALVFPEFKPIVDAFYQRPLTIRDIITLGETGSDTVEYVRVTGVTNNAAFTAEAANTTDGDASGKKPESAMAFARIAESVKTLAHWVPTTTRAVQDAGQLRTIIDAFLLYGILEELEDQILQGNGAGENFTGIFNTANINFSPFDTDVLKTARQARTLVTLNGRTAPTAYVMHPLDWEAIDLQKDSQGRYYFGGPTALGQKTLWGLPVVESEACTQGEAMVANWKFAFLWDRLQSQISVSNSHNDFFVRNLLAVLAEMRAAFGVIRPKAFTQFETVSGGS